MSIDIRDIERLAEQLIYMAELCNAVVTISLEPRQPLAMGHYDMVAHVRPARELADPINREASE